MYSPKTWKDDEIGKTPIKAEDLNQMEKGIANAVETDSVARVSNVVSRNLFNLNTISIGGLAENGTIVDSSSVTINNLDISQGIINFTANAWRGIISDFIKVDSGSALILSGTFSADNYFYRVVSYNANKEFISFFDDFYTMPHNISIPDGVSYIRILLGRGAEAGSISFNGLQLEEGSTATSYVPYLNLEELQEKSNDTGWIDLSSCVNTTYFAVREGHSPMARKINGIVYWKGMVYCYKDVGDNNIDIFQALPTWVLPSYEVNKGGVQWGNAISYTIFIDPYGRIIIRQSQNITSQSDSARAYALTNISGYPTD